MGKVKVPPILPKNISNINHANRNIFDNGTPLMLANVEDISQLDSVQEVAENDIRIQKLSTGENNAGVVLLPMGSVNGVIDQQFENSTALANLENANMEAERGRRALKSQGTSRPFNKNRRT